MNACMYMCTCMHACIYPYLYVYLQYHYWPYFCSQQTIYPIFVICRNRNIHCISAKIWHYTSVNHANSCIYNGTGILEKLVPYALCSLQVMHLNRIQIHIIRCNHRLPLWYVYIKVETSLIHINRSKQHDPDAVCGSGTLGNLTKLYHKCVSKNIISQNFHRLL